MCDHEIKPGTGGDCYVPYEKRTGEESIVYFTRDLSPEGLRKIYRRVCANLSGKVGIKLHTGEKNGPNIIPRDWVENLIREELPEASIVETNTYYEGDRYTTEQHKETLKVNGWTFCPVDIMDAEGTVMLPVKNGKWFTEMSVGKTLPEYDSLLVLTHFKGHTKGGFGGSNKNIGIGCADGRIGKAMIHTTPGSDDMWDIGTEEFMERMTESAKATVDLVYALKEEDHRDLVERMESRHGLRQLTYMKELGMGNDKYRLINIDNGDAEIRVEDAVANVKPFVQPGIIS